MPLFPAIPLNQPHNPVLKGLAVEALVILQHGGLYDAHDGAGQDKGVGSRFAYGARQQICCCVGALAHLPGRGFIADGAQGRTAGGGGVLPRDLTIPVNVSATLHIM